MEDLIPLIVSLIIAHPRGVAYLSLSLTALAIVGNAWQLVPSRTREALALRYPRAVVPLRIVAAIAANVVKAALIARHAPRAGDTPAPGLAVSSADMRALMVRGLSNPVAAHERTTPVPTGDES